jgi:hypothetical protein
MADRSDDVPHFRLVQAPVNGRRDCCGGDGGSSAPAQDLSQNQNTDPRQQLLTGPGDPHNYVPIDGFESWTTTRRHPSPGWQRIGTDGSVRGLTPPQNALPAVYSSLASSIPPLSSYSFTGGYALPSMGVGSSAGILVYVSGTSKAMTLSERASGFQGVSVHRFAR